MYNHSCDEYDALNSPAADPFTRICPLGAKSCFYITGKYEDQTLIFRGCAEAMHEHDFGCDSDMQLTLLTSEVQRNRLMWMLIFASVIVRTAMTSSPGPDGGESV